MGGSTSRVARVAAAAATVAAITLGFFVLAPAASAHHPEISGGVNCAPNGFDALFLSESWQKSGGDSGGGANPSIGIEYRLDSSGEPTGPWIALTQKAEYAYTQANGYQFGDTITFGGAAPAEQIQFRATALADWGNGADGGQQTESAWYSFPTDCTSPGEPQVSSSVACTEGDGVVTIELANVGGTEPVEFVVTDPRTAGETTVNLAPGESDSVVLEGFADGSYTIGVTADGVPLDQEVEVACDKPGEPEVSSSVACTEGDGVVTIELANVGGTEPVEFVVTDPRTAEETTVSLAPGESDSVVLEGFADGSYTIGVTADGVPLDQEVEVACDVPGVPEVSSSVACTEGDGVVTIELANVGGTEPVEFVVTDPRTAEETTVSLAPGESDSVVLEGFADGSYTIGVTADGAVLDQTVIVQCDEPGVPEVSSSVACTEGDGVVTIELANVGGTEPVEFVVTDPRTAEETTVTLAPGESDSVVLEGFADGSHTIGVTADGVPLDQSVEVACDEPGIPAVTATAECVDEDGTIVLTLTNEGVPGTNLPVSFDVTDPVDGSVQTVVVEAGESAEVTFVGLLDGDRQIDVSADGTALDPIIATIDCDETPPPTDPEDPADPTTPTDPPEILRASASAAVAEVAGVQQAQAGSLPVTGSTLNMALAGLALLVFGAMLVVARRRGGNYWDRA